MVQTRFSPTLPQNGRITQGRIAGSTQNPQALRGVLAGGEGGIEPGHVGRIVIPDGHGQDHSTLQGFAH